MACSATRSTDTSVCSGCRRRARARVTTATTAMATMWPVSFTAVRSGQPCVHGRRETAAASALAPITRSGAFSAGRTRRCGGRRRGWMSCLAGAKSAAVWDWSRLPSRNALSSVSRCCPLLCTSLVTVSCCACTYKVANTHSRLVGDTCLCVFPTEPALRWHPACNSRASARTALVVIRAPYHLGSKALESSCDRLLHCLLRPHRTRHRNSDVARMLMTRCICMQPARTCMCVRVRVHERTWVCVSACLRVCVFAAPSACEVSSASSPPRAGPRSTR
eukprot:39211-Pleurochrysis_carterae.AAC.1